MKFNLNELKDHLKPSKNLLVLDGDWLVFQAMSASEQEVDWGNDIWTLTCDHANALDILQNSIEAWTTRRSTWKNATIVVAFSDDTNWRKDLVDENYKTNRKKTRKPCGYRHFVDTYMEREDTICVVHPNLEADDCMGIIGSGGHHFGTQKVTLISIDKDFRTVPNCDFLWCSTNNILPQDQESADFWHLYQTIKGDITDGYSGIKGWGETAEDFLLDPYMLVRQESTLQSGKNKGQLKVQYVKADKGDNSLWDCIVSLGSKVDMSEEDIIKQARMARILRYSDYDFKNQQVILWTPDKLNQ
ncbi:exonuclease [Pasteurella phage vB_PmuP_PHB02]|uniref:Exonuclease n=1 Tax=Pasteurella phage vB_PmuP_PHB02 TaxID=2005054 RepID=A0A1Y0SY67_9CAUD|nr:exonuclease [Pasteurella phage vB_PmuP_PHB02]ARV77584.1 exonuclease [Pasteurella phage vB_PmuP_PHB02]